MIDTELSTYDSNSCITFHKGTDEFGCLGNMTGGFPFVIKGVIWKSSEAFYQALRFPNHLDIQHDISQATNGFTAKLVAKANKDKTRKDWLDVRVTAMLLAMRHKWLCHVGVRNKIMHTMAPIVELSKKDDFWGAWPVDEISNEIVGRNVLGKLWMHIRSNKNDPVEWESMMLDLAHTLIEGNILPNTFERKD